MCENLQDKWVYLVHIRIQCKKCKECTISWKKLHRWKNFVQTLVATNFNSGISDDLVETKLKFYKYFYTLMHAFLQVETLICQSCYIYFSAFARVNAIKLKLDQHFPKLLNGVAKVLIQICQNCYMHLLPSAEPNKAKVWPNFLHLCTIIVMWRVFCDVEEVREAFIYVLAEFVR